MTVTCSLSRNAEQAKTGLGDNIRGQAPPFPIATTQSRPVRLIVDDLED